MEGKDEEADAKAADGEEEDLRRQVTYFGGASGGPSRRMMDFADYVSQIDLFGDPLVLRRHHMGIRGPLEDDPFIRMRYERRLQESQGLPARPVLSQYEIRSRKQRQWYPPMMVEPEGGPEGGVVDKGRLGLQLRVYHAKEKTPEGSECLHAFMQVPPSVPEELKDWDETPSGSRTFNLVMCDVSTSMSTCWSALFDSWNEHVAPRLVGRTSVFTFSEEVALKRCRSYLDASDLECGPTNLTGALQSIVEHVYSCKESCINVFLVTDGCHNVSSVEPETVVRHARCPPGGAKVCSVYLLGIGTEFPVRLSLALRSNLHNGCANVPTLFWAQGKDDLQQEMARVGAELEGGEGRTFRLPLDGYLLPGSNPRRDFYPGEWVYSPSGPTGEELFLSYGTSGGTALLTTHEMPLALLGEVFRQWNGIVVQMNNTGEAVPREVLPFMRRLFESQMQELLSDEGRLSVQKRLQRKDLKTQETDFRTLFNKIEAILTTDKFRNEVELAEAVLGATVGGGKYETKALQKKGHSDADYEEDTQHFRKVYESLKSSILKVELKREDSCRVTLSSTFSDLQDPEFLVLLMENKFEFLKEFTISGIPVHAPFRDSVILNPWTLSIRGIGKEPNSVLSQRAWNAVPQDTHEGLNAIIPIFATAEAQVIGPLVLTKLYAMCATFAILKNPHIVDFSVHLAALGVLWVRLLFENPKRPRTASVCIQMEKIEATARIYLKRQTYSKYWQILKGENTASALMTESVLKVDDRTLKCESLIKPMFLLRLNLPKDPLQQDRLAEILRMILLEYVGRCLSNYKEEMPFTQFFAETLSDQERKKEWILKYVEDCRTSLEGSEELLLQDYYTLERVEKAARLTVGETLKELQKELTAQIPIKVNMEKVSKLRNVSGAGDVSWLTLRTYAAEVGLKEELIEELFGERNSLVYVVHALRHRSSRERLEAPPEDYEASRVLAFNQVERENRQVLSKDIQERLMEQLTKGWLKAYAEAHKEVVRPMTSQEVVREASRLGIQVTEETFDQVYKRFRPDLGLLGNACQCRRCPYYLRPDRSYNQHASVERRLGSFPHALHRTAFLMRDSHLPQVMAKVASGHFAKKGPVPEEAIRDLSGDIMSLQNIYKETANSAP